MSKPKTEQDNQRFIPIERMGFRNPQSSPGLSVASALTSRIGQRAGKAGNGKRVVADFDLRLGQIRVKFMQATGAQTVYYIPLENVQHWTPFVKGSAYDEIEKE